jgi:hypothetical protein
VQCRALLPEAKHWPRLALLPLERFAWPWLTLLSRACLGLQWDYANASPAYRIVAYTAAVVVPLLLFKYGWDWWDQRQRAHKQQMVCDKVRPYLPAGDPSLCTIPLHHTIRTRIVYLLIAYRAS